MSDQEQSNMDRLRVARKAGKRVEIRRHVGGVSGTFSAARENSQAVAESNARGRVARIIGKNGQREFECGVNHSEARELLDAGAVEA